MSQLNINRKRKSSIEMNYEEKRSKKESELSSKIRRDPSPRRRNDRGYCSKDLSRWRSRSPRVRRHDRICDVRRNDRDSGLNSRSYNSGRNAKRDSHVREDSDGHLIFDEGDFLQMRYKLGKVLGKGTFGKVVQAQDIEHEGQEVAVKVVRRSREDFKDAMMEVDIIHNLQRASSQAHKLICRIHDSFDYHGHACIVFDRLGLSLYEFMKKNQYQAFFSADIRAIAYKLLQAVAFCHSEGLAHTDLKPENVLFVHSDHHPIYSDHYKNGTYRHIKDPDVRLIDFGSAVYRHQQKGIVSTRQYRAPEVILGHEWSLPCDIWSVGCILFEMYQGNLLFQTHDSLEHLALMERIMGALPESVLKKGGRGYFKGGRLRWDSDSRGAREVRRKSKPLKSYIREDRHESFFDLLACMLQLQASCRPTASQALNHPFFHSSSTSSDVR